MPPRTEVYGGAGRAYPPDDTWVADLDRSPLRFVWPSSDPVKIAARLVDDTQRMVSLSLRTRTQSGTRRVSGMVESVSAEHTVVRLDDGGQGWVTPGTGLPDISMDHLLVRRQRVTAAVVQDGLLPILLLELPTEKQAASMVRSSYSVGDVVPARITTVEPASAMALLHSQVAVEVEPGDVDEDSSDLTGLLTPGDVVAALVTARPESHGQWKLSLVDVDDEAPVHQAVGVLMGGPPWIEVQTRTEREQIQEPERQPVAEAAAAPEEEPTSAGSELTSRSHEAAAYRRLIGDLTIEIGDLTRKLERAQGQLTLARAQLRVKAKRLNPLNVA